MAKKTGMLSNIIGNVRAVRQIASANEKFDISGKQKRGQQERLTHLWNKYRDQGIVDALMAQRYWIGQHVELLKDSLGPPSAVDQKSMATRQREVWKYHPTGVNRYQLRITIDDGLVVGWDSKDHE